jgi:hypothetical protein
MNYLGIVLAALTAFIMGRNVLVWSFLGSFFGWPVAIVVTLLGPNGKKWAKRITAMQEYHGKLETEMQKISGYEDFETVDDLMKQLENK